MEKMTVKERYSSGVLQQITQVMFVDQVQRQLRSSIVSVQRQ